MKRDVHALRTELQGVERKLARLAEAIAAGGDMPALLEALKARQARRDDLAAGVTAWSSDDVGRFDRRVVETRVRGRLRN